MQSSDKQENEDRADISSYEISSDKMHQEKKQDLSLDAVTSKTEFKLNSTAAEACSETKPVIEIGGEGNSHINGSVIDLLSSEDEGRKRSQSQEMCTINDNSSDDELAQELSRGEKGGKVAVAELGKQGSTSFIDKKLWSCAEKKQMNHFASRTENDKDEGNVPLSDVTLKEEKPTMMEGVESRADGQSLTKPSSVRFGSLIPNDIIVSAIPDLSKSSTSASNFSSKREAPCSPSASSLEHQRKKQKEENPPSPAMETSLGGKESGSGRDALPLIKTPTLPTAAESKQISPTKASESAPTSHDADGFAVSDPVLSKPKNGNNTESLCDPDFASLVKLDPVPDVTPLPMPSPRDVAELEAALQIGDKYNGGPESGWREDWSGNLQLIDKELIVNRDILAKNPQSKPVTMPFCEWVAKTAKDSNSFRAVQLLFSYVYHMKGTPPMAQKIMAYSLRRPAKTVDERLDFIMDGIRRISYDPTVLQQDGWTTVKAANPDGASGGAYLIGRRVIWHRYEAIVIAFVRDEELGDLWKAMWFEDFDTFDLEADELQEALKKWEAKEARKKARIASTKEPRPLSGGFCSKPQGSTTKPVKPAGSTRFAASSNFCVDGIEHGIILAASFHPNARLGVLWPARVMHVSEIKALKQQASRRSSSKNNIHVMFLAPYWNGQYTYSAKGRMDSSRSSPTNAQDAFSTGPLFEMDLVEVSDTTIQPYPYGTAERLSIDSLRQAFRFLGLPKAAFARFLNSHRLAIALKEYARREVSNTCSSTENDSGRASAFAALTDTHIMSVRTAMFPAPLLNLPFDYILESLPAPSESASQLIGSDGEEVTEPIMQLHLMLSAMVPPKCWGQSLPGKNEGSSKAEQYGSNAPSACSYYTPQSIRRLTPVNSPDPKFSASLSTGGTVNCDVNDPVWSLDNFASEYLLSLTGDGSKNDQKVTELCHLGGQLAGLVLRLRTDLNEVDGLDSTKRQDRLRSFLCYCLMVKGHGEDVLASNKIPFSVNVRNVALEWRKACERIYKRASIKFSSAGFGNSVTSVITDSRCNQHLTANGSFERAVRIPAAIRGAKMAGIGSSEKLQLLTKVEDKYMELAESKILPKAHKTSYLKRMKAKIAALPPDAKGAPLTDDSDGEGGEDTMGSRGSYTAAVAGVAAALQAVDMVVGGQSVNVFCAVRPPGHHAGRGLHPMKAISNGFCVLNAAACAAIYATTPPSEGGLGLKRVCVIDFDVHHGNGTQDILCSTHDPRYLYVSLHAGGAHINGFEDQSNDSDNDDGLRRSLGGSSRQEGIFPGRCGDTSPHEGVLNIPLGQKVTAHAIGNALVSRVSPAVDVFAPELVILSAGFDAHKNDPLGMGGLSAEDFGSVTDVACQMAFKSCSGRVLSVLEGGYGVPCCRARNDLFLPDKFDNSSIEAGQTLQSGKNQQIYKLLELGEDLPESMEDELPFALQQKLDRCHAEGFLECVKEHVGSLVRYNNRQT